MPPLDQWNTGIQSPHEGLAYLEAVNTDVVGEITSGFNPTVSNEVPSGSVVLGVGSLSRNPTNVGSGNGARVVVYKDGTGCKARVTFFGDDNITEDYRIYPINDGSGTITTDTSPAFIQGWFGYLIIVKNRDVYYLDTGSSTIKPVAKTGWSQLSGYATCAIVDLTDGNLYIGVGLMDSSSSNAYITKLKSNNNNFNPGDASTYTYTSAALFMPFIVPTSLAGLGSNLIIGTATNALFTWNKLGAFPQLVMYLPEATTSALVVVNNICYVFAGDQGNIYATSGASYWRVKMLPQHFASNRLQLIQWSQTVAVSGNKIYFGANYYQDVNSADTASPSILNALMSLDTTTNELLISSRVSALGVSGAISQVSVRKVSEMVRPFANSIVYRDMVYYATYTNATSTSPSYSDEVIIDTKTLATGIINTPMYQIGSHYMKTTPTRIMLYCADTPKANAGLTLKWRDDINGAWTVVNADNGTPAGASSWVFDGSQKSAVFRFNGSKLRQVQFRIEINPTTYTSGGNTYSYAPKLKQLSVSTN